MRRRPPRFRFRPRPRRHLSKISQNIPSPDSTAAANCRPIESSAPNSTSGRPSKRWNEGQGKNINIQPGSDMTEEVGHHFHLLDSARRCRRRSAGPSDLKAALTAQSRSNCPLRLSIDFQAGHDPPPAAACSKGQLGSIEGLDGTDSTLPSAPKPVRPIRQSRRLSCATSGRFLRILPLGSDDNDDVGQRPEGAEFRSDSNRCAHRRPARPRSTQVARQINL